jgi:hypothetical protein
MLIGTIKTLDLTNVTSNLPEDEAPVYDAEVNFNIADEVIYNHTIYGCLMDGTVGKRPDLHASRYQTPQYWQVKGPTNAFAAVDGVIAVASQNAGNIVLTIDNFANIAGVGIFDASGAQAVARFYDGSNTLVDTKTINLSGFSLNSYYDWIFAQPTSGNTNHVFRNFPANSVKVELTIEGDNTLLDEVSIIETGYNIGKSLYGSKINVASRSIYQDDEFGVPRYIQKPSRVNATFDVFGERAYIETLWGRLRKLSGLRAVYEADASRTVTTGVGIVRDLSVPIDMPTGYLFSIEIEGVQ